MTVFWQWDGIDRGGDKVCPASYCLSIDVAGPFEPGVDQLAGQPKVLLDWMLYSSRYHKVWL